MMIFFPSRSNVSRPSLDNLPLGEGGGLLQLMFFLSGTGVEVDYLGPESFATSQGSVRFVLQSEGGFGNSQGNSQLPELSIIYLIAVVGSRLHPTTTHKTKNRNYKLGICMVRDISFSSRSL